MTRTPSIHRTKMRFRILLLMLLQGVLSSDAGEVSAVTKAGIVSDSSWGSRSSGPGGSESRGGSRSSGSAGPGGSGGSAAASHLSKTTETKSRVKRCTCYSYMDRECVYYCHLDIIWINTPERTVPYGMSGYQGYHGYQGSQRIRRAVGKQTQRTKRQRCICAVVHADPQCTSFCVSRPPPSPPSTSLHRVPGPG